jgi:hypothetical protein
MAKSSLRIPNSLSAARQAKSKIHLFFPQKPHNIPAGITNIIFSLPVGPIQSPKGHTGCIHQSFPFPEFGIAADWTLQFMTLQCPFHRLILIQIIFFI